MMRWLSTVVKGKENKGNSKQRCEDSVSLVEIVRKDDLEMYSFALSDGAGSAKYGKEGAEFLTYTFTERAKEKFSKFKEEIRAEFLFKDIGKELRDILHDVRISLLERAYLENKRIEDYAATFVGGIAINYRGRKKVIYSSVGDSVIFCLKRDSSRNLFPLATNPIVKGEYANTTVFFTSQAWDAVLIIEEITNPDYVFVSSDGLANVFFRYLCKSEVSQQVPIYKKYIWETNIFNNLYNLIERFSEETLKEEELKAFLEEKASEFNKDDKSIIIGDLSLCTPITYGET